MNLTILILRLSWTERGVLEMHGIEIGDYYLIKYQSEVIRGVVFKYHGTENYFVVTDKGRKFDVNYYNFLSKIPESDMSLKVRQIVQMVKEINALENKLDNANKTLDDILLSLKCRSEILSPQEFEKYVRQNISSKVKVALMSPHKYKIEFIFMNKMPIIVFSTSRIVCTDLNRKNLDFISNLGTGYFVSSVDTPMYITMKQKEDKDALKCNTKIKHPFISYVVQDSKLDVEFGERILHYYDGCTLVLNEIPLTEENVLEVANIINNFIVC